MNITKVFLGLVVIAGTLGMSGCVSGPQRVYHPYPQAPQRVIVIHDYSPYYAPYWYPSFGWRFDFGYRGYRGHR
jgi:hypothetical protein